jgi:hypothetical protein
MASRKNDFDPATIRLLDAITDLEFISRASDFQLRKAIRSVEKSLGEYRQERAAEGKTVTRIMGMSSRLLIPDLSSPTIKRVAYGDESKHDEELIELINEINYRLQAQCLCVLYEAFERFLKEFAAPLFYQRRGSKLRQAKQYHSKEKEMAKAEKRNTPEYFSGYVKFVGSSNCRELINEVVSMLPDFAALVSSNWHGDLLSDYRLLSCIRHATVHNDGEPDERSCGSLQSHELRSLNSIILKSVVTSQ